MAVKVVKVNAEIKVGADKRAYLLQDNNGSPMSESEFLAAKQVTLIKVTEGDSLQSLGEDFLAKCEKISSLSDAAAEVLDQFLSNPIGFIFSESAQRRAWEDRQGLAVDPSAVKASIEAGKTVVPKTAPSSTKVAPTEIEL